MNANEMRGYAGAIVLIGDTTLPSVDRVRAHLIASSDEHGHPSSVSMAMKEEALVVEFNDGIGVAAMVTQPIPWSDLKPICDMSWHWPAAATALRKHCGQLIVSIGTMKDDAVHRAILLTRLVASVAAQPNANGVFWVDGGIVHSPAYFLSRCKEMTVALLPLELWVGFNGLQDSDGLVSMGTMGLRKLGHPEIEVRHSSASTDDVFDIVFAAAHYLVDTGTDFQDGDSFEVSDDQEVPVRHVPSSTDPSETAFLLEL